MPGISVLLEEARTSWSFLVEAVSLWGERTLTALVLALLFFTIYQLVLRSVSGLARRFPETGVVERGLRTVLRLTFLAGFLIVTASLFPITSRFVGALVDVYLISLLLFVGWDFLQWVLSRTFTRFGLDASLELLTRNVSRAIWVAVGFYLVFQQFGINLLPILGGLGIAGVALGFAAQDLLSNLIAGMTLLLDRPFTIGDWVRVGSWEGQIVRLTLRTTRMRTRDNELISIPNSKVAGNDVVNLTAGGPLRVRSSLGISYRSDINQARSSLMSVLESEPLILADPPPRVAVMELGDSSVNLDLIYWISAETIARRPFVQQRVLEASKRALDDAGVEIPFPQRVLHLETANAIPSPLVPRD